MIMVILFLGAFVALLVVPALRSSEIRLPIWVPILIVAVILVAFLMVPSESQATVRMFQVAQH